MSAHTPGPWLVYERAEPVGYARFEIHYGNQTECVAEVVHEEANARLIAAAPDLLAALEAMLEYTASLNSNQGFPEYDSDAVKLAFAAIDRAKGTKP